ncbi:hypothetical protein D3C74_430680 [compost metagenome]
MNRPVHLLILQHNAGNPRFIVCADPEFPEQPAITCTQHLQQPVSAFTFSCSQAALLHCKHHRTAQRTDSGNGAVYPDAPRSSAFQRCNIGFTRRQIAGFPGIQIKTGTKDAFPSLSGER